MKLELCLFLYYHDIEEIQGVETVVLNYSIE